MIRSVAIGCGSYLPKKVLTNEQLSKTIDTSDEWIRTRTGIGERRIAGEDELTSHLALRAGKKAITDAGIEANDIDMLILATSTPDLTFPATSTTVHHQLGIKKGAAFDIQAVCSGFIYALTTADAFIQSRKAKTILVIGAETFSRILDWDDRATCVLFGDGAGAVVLQASQGDGTLADRGLLDIEIRCDGAYKKELYADGGVSYSQSSGKVRMIGKEVYRHAVEKLSQVAENLLSRNGLTGADIDWFVPHQANLRIMESTAKRIQLPTDKIIVTVDKHGNTSAASVPLALAEGVQDGRIRPGDLLLTEAIGGGLTWGAALLRW